MKTFIVSGLEVIVPDDVHPVIASNLETSPEALRICYKQNGDLDCVMAYNQGSWVRLHRWIMDAPTLPSGVYVDHIDGNVLNNDVSNLRLCSNAQNQMNSRPHRDKKTKLPKGVTYSKANPNYPYQARISVLGHRFAIGYYATPEQAEQAYLIVAEGLHGQFATISRED